MASLWPNGGNKTIWGKIQAKKNIFFKKILYVIPSALVSFLPYYCHSFRIFVIPSRFVSFLPDFCHSFQICVIPSRFVSFLSNLVIPSKLIPFQIFVILNSFNTLPYLKGEKNGLRSWPYMQVLVQITKILVSHLGYVAIGLCMKYLCYPAITTLAISLNLDFSAAIQAQANSKSSNQLQWYFIPTPRWLLWTYLIQGCQNPWANWHS